jgi:hypothetical protein
MFSAKRPSKGPYWDGSRWAAYSLERASRDAITTQPPAAPTQYRAAQYPPTVQQPYAQRPPYAVAKTQITVSAGTAFKIGFFGFFGAWVAALIPTILIWIFLIAFFASCAAALTRVGASPTP